MPIVVNCPKCQAKLRGPDGLVGKTVRCQGCQEKFRVPGGDPLAESVGDTQQLSVVGSTMSIPAVTLPAAPAFVPQAFVPQAVAPAPAPESVPTPAAAVPQAVVPMPLPAPTGMPDDPLPLDDAFLLEAPKPAKALPLPKEEVLELSDLVEEPLPLPLSPPANAFAFEEPVPAKDAKKKQRDDDDEDDERPKKKKRRDGEDDDDEDDRPRKKKRAESEPVSVPAPLPLPPPLAPASANAFSFDDPAPPTETKMKKKWADDDEDRPKKKKRAEDDDEDDQPRKKQRADDDEDDRPKKKKRSDDDDEDAAKKSGAPWKMIIGIAAVVLVGGGVTAAVLLGGKKTEVAKAPPTTPAVKPKGSPKLKTPEPKTPDPLPPVDPPKDPMPPVNPPKPKDPVVPKPKDPVVPKPKDPPPPIEAKLPDPPAGALALVGKAKHRYTLEVPSDKVKDVRFGGPSAVVAFNSAAGFQEVGVKDTIRQYSAATGAKGGEFEIDSSKMSWPRGFDVDATGNVVAVEAGGAGKVTVYDYAAKAEKMSKVEVFAGVEGRVGPIAALLLGAGNKMFVVDSLGTVDLWDVATQQRVFAGTAPKRPATATGKPTAKACLINNGTVAVVAADGRIWAVDANGAAVGKTITLPDPTATILDVGAGGDGCAAVAYHLTAGAYKYGVAAVHPIKGVIEYSTPLPEGAGAPTEVTWPAPTLLTVSTDGGNGGLIVDVENKCVSGYLKAIKPGTKQFPTGRAHWWLAAEESDPRKTALVGVELPFDDYFNIVRTAKADRVPIYLVPRADGLAK